MKDELTGHDLVAELHLIRSNFRGTLLVLEGETDCKFFDAFIDSDNCMTVPGHGKESVVEAIAGAERAGVGGVLGIVDADYWHLEGEKDLPGSVLITDDHDVEMMMLRSPALDKILRELGSAPKIARFTAAQGVEHVRDFLVREMLPLGLIGWSNNREGWRLSFEGLNLAKSIDKTSLALEIGRLLDWLAQINEYSISKEELEINMKRLAEEAPDPFQVCTGHHVVGLLAVGFRKALGSSKALDCRPERLEADLRLAYTRRYLRKTALHDGVTQWEKKNPGYQVFQS